MLEKLVKSLSNTDISLKENSNGIFKMYINNQDVEDKIRGSRVSKHVSEVAKYEEIREFVLRIQRDISKNKSIVMDGRDIGSFVFPNADVKFYIDASIKTRSERRYNQLKEKEQHLSIREVENDLLNRDNIDKTRKKSLSLLLRNYFIAGIVVLIPIGITLYLTLLFIRISGVIIPKEINPNNYLPFNIKIINDSNLNFYILIKIDAIESNSSKIKVQFVGNFSSMIEMMITV